MKFLNAACGSVRPQSSEWTNIDDLYAVLKPGSPERQNLERESNYRNCDITQRLPFNDETFDAVVASHVIEHFDCMQAVSILKEFRRVLVQFGMVIISVPNCSYFRQMYPLDRVETAEELFGEPIYLPDGERTFFGYGLFNRFHKAVLNEDSLWCYLVRAGFAPHDVRNLDGNTIREELISLLNRQKFSTIMIATK